MPVISLKLDGDGAFPELEALIGTDQLVYEQDPHITIAALEKGMQSGASSLAIKVDLSDGRVVLFETSWAAFAAAARALEARLGAPQ